MLYILLKFVWTIVCIVAVVFLCTYISRWLDKRHGKKTSYRVIYEYRPFLLASDHESYGDLYDRSWEKLLALGAEGWEIAETIKTDYYGIHFILKRETLHQS